MYDIRMKISQTVVESSQELPLGQKRTQTGATGITLMYTCAPPRWRSTYAYLGKRFDSSHPNETCKYDALVWFDYKLNATRYVSTRHFLRV